LLVTGNFPFAREELIADQNSDPSLSCLFEKAVLMDESTALKSGYLLSDGVLLRKWSPNFRASAEDDWSVVTQVVVPSKYRHDILCLAHDHRLVLIKHMIGSYVSFSGQG